MREYLALWDEECAADVEQVAFQQLLSLTDFNWIGRLGRERHETREAKCLYATVLLKCVPSREDCAICRAHKFFILIALQKSFSRLMKEIVPNIGIFCMFA
jgi:hypothetical protein